MRVYISVDMEGIAGVNAYRPTDRNDQGYAAAARLMEGETNAAVAGAFEGGASGVAVNDSHGSMHNLSPEAIDRRARLVQGRKPFSMVAAAADGQFAVALFVGYHARAGHPRGTLAHTQSGGPTLTTLNGRPTGEYGLNAMYLGGLGIPVGMVSGDDALAEEVAEWLPWAERVVVKRGISRQAADSVHPDVARELVRAGAKRAVERAVAGGDAALARDGAGSDSGEQALAREGGGSGGGGQALVPLRLDPPIVVGVDFQFAGMADFAAVMPGFTREGDRGVRYEAADPLEAYRAFVSAVRMAAQSGDD
jgi:D-amino peptidase